MENNYNGVERDEWDKKPLLEVLAKGVYSAGALALDMVWTEMKGVRGEVRGKLEKFFK